MERIKGRLMYDATTQVDGKAAGPLAFTSKDGKTVLKIFTTPTGEAAIDVQDGLEEGTAEANIATFMESFGHSAEKLYGYSEANYGKKEYDGQIATLQNAIEAADNNQELLNQIDSLTSQLQACQTNLSTCQGQLTSAQNQLTAAQNDAASYWQMLMSCNQQAASLNSQVNSMQDQIDELQFQVTTHAEGYPWHNGYLQGYADGQLPPATISADETCYLTEDDSIDGQWTQSPGCSYYDYLWQALYDSEFISTNISGLNASFYLQGSADIPDGEIMWECRIGVKLRRNGIAGVYVEGGFTSDVSGVLIPESENTWEWVWTEWKNVSANQYSGSYPVYGAASVKSYVIDPSSNIDVSEIKIEWTSQPQT